MTWPNGAKPCASSDELSARLMNTCVVRVFGPAVANVTVHCVFGCLTGSSWMSAFCQACATAGFGWIPNWTTKPGTTRKKRTPS